jgi:hypothetical protein
VVIKLGGVEAMQVEKVDHWTCPCLLPYDLLRKLDYPEIYEIYEIYVGLMLREAHLLASQTPAEISQGQGQCQGQDLCGPYIELLLITPPTSVD